MGVVLSWLLTSSKPFTPNKSLLCTFLNCLPSLPPNYPFFPLTPLALTKPPNVPINLSSLAPKTLLRGSNSTC